MRKPSSITTVSFGEIEGAGIPPLDGMYGISVSDSVRLVDVFEADVNVWGVVDDGDEADIDVIVEDSGGDGIAFCDFDC